MNWLRRFWLFWWQIWMSYVLGSIVRRHGARILFVDSTTGVLMQGYASACGGDRWYVRSGVNNEEVSVVYTADRSVTWVWGWEGSDADALRAQHLLIESAS